VIYIYIYDTGFPKSLDVSKAIDRAAGAERQIVGSKIGIPGVSASGANRGRGSVGSTRSGSIIQRRR
jgi:hypothetical protein